MAECFLGQIMMTGFNFAQQYFARCDGQLLAINQNQALFSLLGVTYGGDGQNTYGLPDLRGRTPAGAVTSADSAWRPSTYVMGQRGGTETVTLTAAQNPVHTHAFTATTDAGVNQYLDGNVTLAQVSDPAKLYGAATSLVALSGGPTGTTGGQPHNNMQPFEVINFNIALQGVFPSRG